MTLPNINSAPLTYWSLTGYTEQDIRNFCSRYDSERLIALITFSEDNPASITISKKTWEIQQGHYGAIFSFFKDMVSLPIAKQLKGSIIVWLDDGAHNYEYEKLKEAPTFVFGRCIHDAYTLLIPDPAFMESRGYAEELSVQRKFEKTVPFKDRLPTIFWRGAASGLGFDETGWRKTPRGMLTLKAKALNNPSMINALFTKIEGWTPQTKESICTEGILGSHVPFLDFLKYRYLIDTDGIHCAWISLFRKLASQSVTVKMMTENQQWYYDKLKPWQHFVPIRGDAEDIEDVYKWLVAHPNECQDIVRNANSLIESLSYQQELEQTALLIQRVLSLRRER